MNEAEYQAHEAARHAQAASINSFAYGLYQRVAKTEENLFFSPLSIHSAMRMALAGAGGKTAEELGKAMRISNVKTFHLNFDGDPQEAGGEVNIANALWAQAGYTFNDQFLIDVKREQRAWFEEVDFRDRVEAAATISDWIERRTHGRIRDMIDPAAIGPLTRLILTNAIYFRADWREKFDPTRTKPAPFLLADGQTVDVPMMRQKDDFWAADSERFQSICMFYVR